jgi:hypothetical protein
MGLYSIYLTDMLEEIAAIGDEKQQNEEKKQADTVVGRLNSVPVSIILICSPPSSPHARLSNTFNP